MELLDDLGYLDHASYDQLADMLLAGATAPTQGSTEGPSEEPVVTLDHDAVRRLAAGLLFEREEELEPVHLLALRREWAALFH